MTNSTTDAPRALEGASGVASAMARIAESVTGPNADDVDRAARFPTETIDALRAEGLLSALVPVDLGGAGASIGEVARGVTALGRQCASTAMVVAMHHIQVSCLVRHGRNPTLRAYLAELAEHQELLASATTEIGTGGDVRRSISAVEVADGSFSLEKQAPVISYGSHADAVLATARRTPDSPESDQVIVVCRPPGLELDQVGGWNALGFRGTCSPGFVLRARGDTAYIVDDPYGDVSARTMLPASHLLWGSVWLGIALDAVDRARRSVQADARRHPGTTPLGAARLADAVAMLQQFEDLVQRSIARYEELTPDDERLTAISFAVAMNSLKVSASTFVVDVVRECMLVSGLSSYLLDSPSSLGRHLRDAMGAALMVNNERIMANNAQLLLVHRGE